MVLPNFKENLEKYAKLLVANGINVQPGHTLVLNIDVEQRELAHLIVKEAYALGECALVPDPSPISQSGITFFNTLFDENASNHLAIGAAYATSVEGGAEFTEEELEAAGLNRSDVHVDFMIGSSQMDIDGIREDGTRVPVFRNGDWAI